VALIIRCDSGGADSGVCSGNATSVMSASWGELR
jgi:hypothetical protein